jgi:hypothetical protein
MKTIGYYKEYYIGNKYIGKESCDKDRETIGFAGRTWHRAESDIKIGKKKIKKGTDYATILYPLQGKHIQNGTDCKADLT